MSAVPGNSVTISWAEPANDGGAAITGYRIYRGTTSGGETLLLTVPRMTTYTDETTVDGTTYYFQVAAVNSAGEGPRSGELSAMPATVPGAPTITSATAGNGTVALAWSAPTSGGAPITNYSVFRGTASGGETLLTTLGNVGGWTDTGLVNGTTYFYKVSASNFKGEGSRSGETSATPKATGHRPGQPVERRGQAERCNGDPPVLEGTEQRLNAHRRLQDLPRHSQQGRDIPGHGRATSSPSPTRTSGTERRTTTRSPPSTGSARARHRPRNRLPEGTRQRLREAWPRRPARLR